MRILPALVLAAATSACGEADWNLEAIRTAVTPPDPPLVCGAQLPADMAVTPRADCSFIAGARAVDTLGLTPEVAGQIPIRHVIILMKENRSFDHVLGRLHDQGQDGVEPIPADYQNRDLGGNVVTPFHSPATCLGGDPDHQWGAMHVGINGGAMDGFVGSAAVSTDSDGHFVLGHYKQSDLPFYYWLASTFALGDRHFSPMASGTEANRAFFLLGTNAGIVNTSVTSFPSPTTNSIFAELLKAGYTWGVYTDSEPFSGALGWDNDDPGVHPMSELFAALDNGTLPNVVFVDGVENVDDDHPTADLQTGEAWTRNIYEHAIKSPQWQRLAIIWTYDEGGGFADHVPPPRGCAPSAAEKEYTERGPRVPFVVISPWARRHYVSHVSRDHVSITRFIEALFDLPALTMRDANSDALLDMFDFSCGRDLSAPEAPAAGTGGCGAAR